MDKKEKAQQAIKDLFNCINILGGENEIKQVVLEEVAEQHRTLKQAFMRAIIVPYIQQMAEDYKHGYYDLRNEATCQLCNELDKIVKKQPLPFI